MSRLFLQWLFWVALAGNAVAQASAVDGFGAPLASDPAQPRRLVEAMRAKLNDFGQLSRYHDADAALPPQQSGRVVFLGDSITNLWTKNGGRFFPGKPYVNRGIIGQTTPQMLVRFRQDVIELHPTAVVILAGTNDIAGNTGPETLETIEGNLMSMTELARANGIHVLLASLLPTTDYPWRRGLEPATKIRALNEWIANYCKEQRLVYVDYYSSLTDENGGTKQGLSKDGVHPNASGYAIMQLVVEGALKKVRAENTR